jgi:23S rRNA pseudouridine1911/1915/1917 synthase
VEFSLITGRQHQVRAQASLHGHPLAGERMYRTAAQPARIDFPRQALHALRLAFEHPSAGLMMTFDAPVPRDMRRLVASLVVSRTRRERVP